jgi:hypothetical protein
MGSVVQFDRRRPLRHQSQPVPQNAQHEDAREAVRSLWILIGAFFVTAVVMCVVVVAVASSTWTDVLVISAFVIVFALIKIVLANILMYAMIRHDEGAADVAVKVKAGGAVFRRTQPQYRTAPTLPQGRRHGSIKSGAVRLAVLAGNPSGPPPRP